MTRRARTASMSAAAPAATMMQAAGEVIAARMAMMSDPAGMDLQEMALMSTEKLEAAAASAASLQRSASRLGGRMIEQALEETRQAALAAAAVATAATPAESLAAQSAWATGWWSRATQQALSLNRDLLRAQAEALRPIHDRAVANARRLRRP